MDRKYLLGATTALAVAFGAAVAMAASDDAATSNMNSATTATGQGAGATGTAAGATDGRQVAEGCLEELNEVEQRLAEEGRTIAGSDLRALHQAATIFARNGMDDACEDVVEGIGELGEQTAARGELSDEQRAEYEQSLREARPIDELPGRHRASELIGREVVTLDGRTIGDVDDVMIGADGQTRYLLIGSGGFLGIGEDYVPVEFSSVRVVDEDTLAVAVDAERFDAAPRVKTDSIDERVENWTADVEAWWDRNVRDQEAQAQ